MPRHPWKTEAEYNEHWLARVRADADRNESGCLISRASVAANGYSQTNHRTKTVRVHRQLYKIVHGLDLPPSIDICHRCDNRQCIEITHLWHGTRKQNVDDMTAKARHWSKVKTHCKYGHEFSLENTEVRQSRGKPGQGRSCKKCALVRNRIKAGWSKELAENMPVTPHGYRPVNGDFSHMRKQRSR